MQLARSKLLGDLLDDRDGRLDEDWPGVEGLVYKMNRASGDLYSMLQSLVLRVQTGEGRKQRRA